LAVSARKQTEKGSERTVTRYGVVVWTEYLLEELFEFFSGETLFACGTTGIPSARLQHLTTARTSKFFAWALNHSSTTKVPGFNTHSFWLPQVDRVSSLL